MRSYKDLIDFLWFYFVCIDLFIFVGIFILEVIWILKNGGKIIWFILFLKIIYLIDKILCFFCYEK